MGGSYYMERRTNEIEAAIVDRIQEVESLGRPTDLVDRGWFRNVFSEAMVKTAMATAEGTRPVVGVNCFTVPEAEDTMLREHTDTKFEPCVEHIDTIRRWKESRPSARLEEVLASVSATAADPDANLIPVFVDALEAGASMGEAVGAFRVAHGLTADPYEKVASR